MSIPFLYQLLGATYDSSSATDFGAAVVDMDDSKLTAEQLAALQAQGKKVFTYISIGEAESYRGYWTGPDWTTNPPGFLLEENPDWIGNYRVKFWDADWQQTIFDRIDQAVALGYDGIYLDIVDAYAEATVRAAYTGADIRTEMVNFIIAISQHAKAQDPDFKIIPQNAPQLLALSDNDTRFPNQPYLDAIDGIGIEDLWYSDDDVADWTQSDLAFLGWAIVQKKFVLATSYPKDEAHQAEFVAKALANGLIPYVGDRLLNDIIDPINFTIGDLLPQSTVTPWTVLPAPPAAEGPLTDGANEDSGALSVDLLQGASDKNGDTLSITDLSELPAGVTLDGTTLSVDTNDASFQSLAAGATREINVSYQISDGEFSVSQTATITITGVNDGPAVGDAITAAADEDSGVLTVDLLQGALDIDGDTLSVIEVSELPAGVTLEGSTLSVDTNDAAFQDLAAGATRDVVVTYKVSDGAGGTVDQTATITITGANEAPTVAAPLAASANEDSGVLVVDLLAGAADEEGDALSITDVSALPDGVTLDGSSLSVDTNNAAFQSLAAGVTRDIVVTYSVSDGAHSVAQSATITITGVNDGPSVGEAITRFGDEDTGVVTLDLLAGAADVDGDTLFIADVGELPAGVTLDGSTLSIDTSDAVFQALAAGATRLIEITYAVTDGTESVAQTASFTVTGWNDVASITGASTGAVSEDGVLTASGVLTVTDADEGESTFATQAGIAALYGAFSIDAAGAWSYTLNNAHAAVQALNTGQSLTDTIEVRSVDGTAHKVVVTIAGLDDHNVINGSFRSDDIRGTSGNDRIDGLNGNDEISARSGDDIVFGGEGFDKLYGGTGNDEMHGGLGRDLLEGDEGDDWLYGEDSYDEINAGTGNDHLFGGADGDDLSGEDGDDVIEGGAGNDWMNGGRGNDTFVFKPGFGEDVISDFDASPFGGQDRIDLSAFGITSADFDVRVRIQDVRGAVIITIDGDRNQKIIIEDVQGPHITIDDFFLG